jgi:hypothetical protein
LAVRASGQFFQRFGEPAQRVEAVEFGGREQARDGGGAAAGALRAANNQFFLPTAMGRMAFSTGLLSMGCVPESA